MALDLSNSSSLEQLALKGLISDIQTLWRSGLSARVPEHQKFKMYLDLDGRV